MSNVAANVQRNTTPGPGPSRSKSKDDVVNELVLLENIYVSLKTLKTFWHPATSPAKIFTFHNKNGNKMEYDSLILLSCQHCFYESQSLNLSLYPTGSSHENTVTIIQIHKYKYTRSLGALRAPTSSLWPFGPALGTSGLLDFILRALRALRPCDPRDGAMIG